MPTSPFTDFTALAPNIHHLPSPLPTSSSTSDPPNPSLIILCAWLSAPPRPVSKYIHHYRAHHPNASLLILQTDMSDTTLPTALCRTLDPARTVLLAHLSSFGPRSVLLHAFSNGGAHAAVRLLRSLPGGGGGRDVLLALVLDCCPGTGSVEGAVQAMAVSLPRDNAVVSAVGRTLLWVVVVLVAVLERVFGVRNVVDRAREGLLDGNLVGQRTTRAYLYGRKDRLVLWTDVERHARQAKEKGFRVKERCFDEGAHCALIVSNAKEYWEEIENVLDEGRAVASEDNMS